jgi:glycerophosphoryl diester phosphodiesterase
MDVLGHRGCAAEFPENTLAAIRGCASRVDMVELDVRRCRSGELVVFHDERVDRLTDETGAIETFGYDELSALTVGDSDESIPTLADALAALPEDTGVNIELKEAKLHEQTLGLVSAVPHEGIISSFDPDALDPFRDAPVPTALLCAESTREVLETAIELDCAYLHPQYTAVDAESIECAHSYGLTVNAWTVPSETAVRRLQAGGIDGVIVDSWTVIPRD